MQRQYSTLPIQTLVSIAIRVAGFQQTLQVFTSTSDSLSNKNVNWNGSEEKSRLICTMRGKVRDRRCSLSERGSLSE